MQTIEYIAHLFYPRYSNNHKAKVLHSSSLFLIAGILVLFQMLLNLIPASGLRVLGYAANISPSRVIELINSKRTASGLTPLNYNSQLETAAKAKAAHMINNDYWAHTAPDGTEPWKFFTDAGYKYKYAGENLARDFSNPDSAVDAWMASTSHKDNIMSSKYTETGVAVIEGDLAGTEATIIVQLFGSKELVTASQLPQAITATVKVVPTEIPEATVTPDLIAQENSATPVAEIALQQPISPVPTINQVVEKQQVKLPVQEVSGWKVLISPFNTTRGVSLITTLFIISVMLLDSIVVFKRKIPRVGGRTFAHLAFLTTIALILLISKVGQIL